MEDKLLTAAQVAAILKLDINTVGQYLREGRITGEKLGRSWRVRSSDLQVYIDKKKVDRKQIRRDSIFYREQLAHIFYSY
ncbi:MAG TPA: helix-turn-helix domain-containing protein [Patescibacteria group bacterium]|nr:helix-turn-helix domain-containing protein [Patescibacteria group bacterium]